jgi:cytosine/adenosine deaminase-related metal-dependent hydrolase
MKPLPARYGLRARYVLSPGVAPLASGWVNICAGRIESIATEPTAGPQFDLGNVAILPGLVNAHTHLEFSDLQQPLGEPGIELTEWITQLLALRDAAARPSYASRVATGIAESVGCGTVAIADIVTSESLPADPLPLDYLALRELIATGSDESAEAILQARSHLVGPARKHLRLGISPHAPYSVHARLWEAAIELAMEYHVPLATHLAESRAELEFLAAQSGPFAKFLSRRPGFDASFAPAGRTPLDFLRQLVAAPRVLVVHGNYLNPAEIDFLSQQRERLSLVYCPRTHAYFGHLAYPLEALLAAGVEVALGTDGRCSNPDLSIFAEMQFLAANYPRLTGDAILTMGTLAGARALGVAERMGTLEAGKEANLALVRLPESGSGEDTYPLLFDSKCAVAGTLFCGVRVAGEENLFQPPVPSA